MGTDAQDRIIMTKEDMKRALVRITHEILERNKGASELAIIGIKTRGAIMAQRLVSLIKEIDGTLVPLGLLDINLYRDDLTDIAQQPIIGETKIKFDVTDKIIILVDDVLYTGRTIRCALDAIIDFGRPKLIQLAVLLDRGHRELPIRAEYVGKNVPTSQKEVVEVSLEETDKKDEVSIRQENND